MTRYGVEEAKFHLLVKRRRRMGAGTLIMRFVLRP